MSSAARCCPCCVRNSPGWRKGHLRSPGCPRGVAAGGTESAGLVEVHYDLTKFALGVSECGHSRLNPVLGVRSNEGCAQTAELVCTDPWHCWSVTELSKPGAPVEVRG